MDFKLKECYGIQDLLDIMVLLRSENGCPWDKVQTHQSIRKNFIEETYEVVDAIDKQDMDLLKEELGDALLQVVFHSQMESEKNNFNFDDVCDGICKKLIVRHPHIFSDGDANTVGEVLTNWDRIKAETKGQKTATDSVKDVPTALPSLMRSEKVQHRAAKTGFDYPNLEYAMSDLESELCELKQAIANEDKENEHEELGDLLFAAVNVARFLDLDPEKSLYDSCEKFITRFSVTEKLAEDKNVDMKSADIEKLNSLWKEAKNTTNK